MARVLVIEADLQIRVFVAGILTDFGHDVQQCGGADEAGRHLAASAFDVLATDLVLGEACNETALACLLPIMTLTGEPHRSPVAGRPLSLRDRPFRFADLHRLVAAVARCSSGPRAIAA
jgi:DNA-binding response OmpR family regulator